MARPKDPNAKVQKSVNQLPAVWEGVESIPGPFQPKMEMIILAGVKIIREMGGGFWK